MPRAVTVGAEEEVVTTGEEQAEGAAPEETAPKGPLPPPLTPAAARRAPQATRRATPPRAPKPAPREADDGGAEDDGGGSDRLEPVNDTPTLQGPGPQQPAPAPPAGVQFSPIRERREPREDKRWHVVVDGKDGGPVDFSELRARVIAGTYNGDTLLFRPGMTTSVRLETIEGLAKHLPRAMAASSAPPPAAQQGPAFRWWLNPIIEGQPFRGPFDLAEMRAMYANGELTMATMVHRSDLAADHWASISSDRELLTHNMPPLNPSCNRDWSVWDGTAAQPYCFRELETAVRERRVVADTYVSHPQHAPKWAALESVSALRALRKIIADLGPAPTSIPTEHQRWAPPAATAGAASASVPSAQQGAPAPQAPAQQPAPVVTPQYLRFCTSCRAPLAPYPGNRYCQLETCRAKQY